jgi:hypothetical protein
MLTSPLGQAIMIGQNKAIVNLLLNMIAKKPASIVPEKVTVLPHQVASYITPLKTPVAYL